MARDARALEPTCRKVHGLMQHNISPDSRMGKSLWDAPFVHGSLHTWWVRGGGYCIQSLVDAAASMRLGYLSRPQFWVIDAMNECKGAANMLTFLTRIQDHWPLPVLVTSS